MSNRVVAFVAGTAVISLYILACGGSKTDSDGFVAPGTLVPQPGIEISLHNDQGIAVAQGTSAVVVGVPDSTTRSVVRDSVTLDVYVGPGTYSVRLSKPFYRDTTLTGIVVASGDFGMVQTTRLAVTLHALPASSVVRSIAIFGAAFLEQPGAQARLSAVLDAAPGVSRTVHWAVDDSALATIDRNGLVIARCSTRGGTVTATARSAADPSVFSIARLAVAPAAFGGC